MFLEAGTRLGPYQILGLLGSGGMGEVYRALDPRLGRELAVKVLAPHLARRGDALGRFEREARAASALNHPHIVAVYQVDDAETAVGPLRFIAMELVEGTTLRVWLRQATGWKQAVQVLTPIADALARAHAAGLVHRDLKPENVMVTPDGYPKLLDFGLAKLVAAETGGASETGEEVTPTRSGMIVGTPGYMAPEQVEGRPVDHRTDVFAFGCILYEALSGSRAFQRDSAVKTLHAVVYEEPAALDLSAGPPALRMLVARCLQKDPAHRPASMAEIVRELREAVAGTPEAIDTQAATATRTRPAPRSLLPGLILVVAALTLTGLLLRRTHTPSLTGAPSATPAPRLVVSRKLTNRGDVKAPALSRDGQYLAFLTRQEGGVSIWLKDVREGTETRVVSAISGAVAGLAIPDGRALYFVVTPQGGKTAELRYVPLIGGGEPRLLHRGGWSYLPSPNGESVAAIAEADGAKTLVVIPAGGGAKISLGPAVYVHAWSADGRRIAFESGSSKSVGIVDADGTGRHLVDLPASSDLYGAWWRPDGSELLVLLGAGGQSTLARLDLKTAVWSKLGAKSWAEISRAYWLPGGTTALVQGRPHEPGAEYGVWRVSLTDGTGLRLALGHGLNVAADGTSAVFTQGHEKSEILVGSGSDARSYRRILNGSDVSHWLAWTPDRRLLHSSNDAGTYDISVCGADGANRHTLGADRHANETEPVASPDGRWIVYVSDRAGTTALWRMSADGSDPLPLTAPAPGHGDRRPQVTPDGRWVVYSHWDNGPTLWKIPIDGGTPQLVRGERGAATVVVEVAFGAGISPDGASLAYFFFAMDPKKGTSDTDIVVGRMDGTIRQRFPYASPGGTVGDVWRVQWSADGRSLYYGLSRDGVRNLWRQPLAGGTPTQVTRFDDDVEHFAWSPDSRILALARTSGVTDVVLLTGFD